MKEYKVGEKFEHDGVELEVFEEISGCRECYFSLQKIFGQKCKAGMICGADDRVDGKDVIYKEAEKGNKPICSCEDGEIRKDGHVMFDQDIVKDLEALQLKRESKVEFESEEEAREFYKCTIWRDHNGHWENKFIDNCKERGYLKRSALEEAKSNYMAYCNKEPLDHNAYAYIKGLENKVTRLEKELEEKECGNDKEK